MEFHFSIDTRRYIIGAEDPRNWVLRQYEVRDVANPKTKEVVRKEVETVLGYFSKPEAAVQRLITTEIAEYDAVATLENVQRELRGLRDAVVANMKVVA